MDLLVETSSNFSNGKKELDDAESKKANGREPGPSFQL
jgi:hypothetical protein